MQEAMERQMGEFFALSQKERAHFLDREIEKMELLSRAPSAGPVRVGLPAGGHPGGGDEAGGDVFIGGPPSISPKMRAQMAEYMTALRNRRAERGLPEFPPLPPPPKAHPGNDVRFI